MRRGARAPLFVFIHCRKSFGFSLGNTQQQQQHNNTHCLIKEINL
jgi:hypothetical protein